jgi:TetR/AcrR family transcriptional regulator
MTSAERRAAILQAAIKLFAERGFRGTTTRELAASVGVSEPVLYQHFETKRDLYKAIIEAKMHQVQNRAQALLTPYVEAQDDRGFFLRLGELILEFYQSDPDYIRLLWFSALERNEFAGMFRENHSHCFYSFVGEVIGRAVEQGRFRKVDPLIATRVFAGMIGSYALAVVVFGKDMLLHDRPASEAVSGMVDIFLNGVLAGSENS